MYHDPGDDTAPAEPDVVPGPSLGVIDDLAAYVTMLGKPAVEVSSSEPAPPPPPPPPPPARVIRHGGLRRPRTAPAASSELRTRLPLPRPGSARARSPQLSSTTNPGEPSPDPAEPPPSAPRRPASAGAARLWSPAQMAAAFLAENMEGFSVNREDCATRTELAVWPAAPTRRTRSQLLFEMEACLAAAPRPEPGGTTAMPDLEALWRPYREAFLLFIGRSTEYKAVLMQICNAADTLLRQYSAFKDTLAAQRGNVVEEALDHQRRTRQMRSDFAERNATLEAQVRELTAKAEQQEGLGMELQKKLGACQSRLEATLRELLATEKERDEVQKSLKQRMEARTEADEYLRALKAENDTLHQVQKANQKLSLEVAALQEDRINALATLQAQRQAVNQQTAQSQQREEAVQAMAQNLRRVCRIQAEEIQSLETRLAEQTARCDEAREQRAMMQADYTPRPAWPGLAAAHRDVLQAAAVSDEQPRTALALQRVLEFATHQLGASKQTRRRLAALQALYDFVTEDDIQRLQEVGPPPPGRYFVGLGTHPAVPPHLRWHGWLPCRPFAADALGALVADFWQERWLGPGDADHRTVQEAFAEFLSKRYPEGAQQAAEAAYNVEDSLRGSPGDARGELLLRVLRGDLPEEAPRALVRSIAGLLQAFRDAEHAARRGVRRARRGVLKRPQLRDVLQRHCPAKSLPEVLQLDAAIARDAALLRPPEADQDPQEATEDIKFEALFPVSWQEELPLHFLKTFRTQFLLGLEQMQADVAEALGCLRDEDGCVAPRHLMQAMLFVDPRQTEEAIHGLLGHVWGDASVEAGGADATPKAFGDVVSALKRCCVLRVGPRPDHAAAPHSHFFGHSLPTG